MTLMKLSLGFLLTDVPQYLRIYLVDSALRIFVHR